MTGYALVPDERDAVSYTYLLLTADDVHPEPDMSWRGIYYGLLLALPLWGILAAATILTLHVVAALR